MLSKVQVSKKIGAQIRMSRVQQKLSQEELAHRAGLYRTYIGHVEVGRYTPSVYTVYKIAQGLKIRCSELLSF